MNYELQGEKESTEAFSHHVTVCWEKVLNKSMASMKYEFFNELCFPPLGPEFHFRRGLIMDILHYDDFALIEYSKAIDQNPTDALYYNNRANIYQVSGFIKQAIEDLDVAISLNPYKAELYLNRAKAKKTIGDFEGANKDYGYAIELGICKKYPTLKICTDKEAYTKKRGQ
ncbi:MAG: tetratricopeptide repeat protein [Deltaproteobacteria bacterium]|nr:tetratricopeptide repeat protein [Candidatus Zymogenaceae bacterium]